MASDAPLWKRCLDPDARDAEHYNDYVHAPLFELIEAAPMRVLDLGCATGAFGAELKRRFPPATVVGIEAAAAAAAIARTRLDRVIVASLDDMAFEDDALAGGGFDTVIASDVLEHLVNPWRLLERLHAVLAPGARVLASIPNVRNLTVVSALLLAGRFDYDERGLLDITHLRFFTLHGMRRLFEGTGYTVERDLPLILPSLEPAYRGYRGREKAMIRLGRMTVSDLTPAEVTELCAAQFLLRARVA